jgi:hypothetical protein
MRKPLRNAAYGAATGRIRASVKRNPDDALLFDLLLVWAPNEKVRRLILIDNPAVLYDYPKSA